jgi:hypothetical protein
MRNLRKNFAFWKFEQEHSLLCREQCPCFSISDNDFLQTLQIPDKDTIDCVHMFHQPHFDYPLLKNHTIHVSLSTLQISSSGTKTNLQMVIFSMHHFNSAQISLFLTCKYNLLILIFCNMHSHVSFYLQCAKATKSAIR